MIVEVNLIVKAYSPYDSIDKEYRAKNPIPITARGADCRRYPMGIAGFLPNFPAGATISVPGYNSGSPTLVDDTGGYIRKAKGKLIEVRFPTSKEAKEWGIKELKVTIYIPDKEKS